MTNITELNKSLCDAYMTLSKDRAFCPQAHEMANMAGKILNAQKIQMEYAKMTNSRPDIEFMK